MNQDYHILYEDNHLLVVNKQSSEIVQGDKTGDEAMVDKYKRYIQAKYNKPGNVFLGLVHRIDRPVSGAVIFAKTSKALGRMNEVVKEHRARKIYWAVVLSAPPKKEDRLVNFLVKNEKQNKSFVSNESNKNAKRAELTYKYLASSDKYHLLEVELLTGRHHQIRVQLSHIGLIIKGDLKYGAPRSNTDGSINLHARKLEFIHPVNQSKICVIAPTPQDALWKFFSAKKLD